MKVLGYLGASAFTAYLAAFGITLSTHAGVIDAAGAALEPSPSLEDEGGDDVDPDDLPVVPSEGPGSHAVMDVASTTPASTGMSVRGSDDASRPAGGRHAASPVGSSPTVPLRVVRAPQPAGAVAAPASTPTPTTPATPTTGGTAGGGSSSGGAGPTTGTGTTGGGTTGGGTTGGGTTGGTTTPTTTPTTPAPTTGTDTVTSDILTIGSGANTVVG